MAVQIQVRRGSTAEHSTFTGAVGEITMDTTKNVVVVHNGSIVGGFPLALASGSAITAASLLVNNNLNISTGNAYQINGVSVLSATTLGSGVTASSLTSVGTLSALTVTGDLTVDTSTLKVDSANNRVGIGTASPGAILDIRQSTSGGVGPTLSLINSAATANGNAVDINMAGNPGGGALAPTARIRVTEDGTAKSTMTFWTYDGSSLATRATIDPSGNLGVGTTSPSSAGATYAGIDVRGSGGGSIRYGVSSGFNMLTYATGTQADFVTSTAGDIRFFNRTASGESARITAGGYFKASNDGTYAGATSAYHELRGASASDNVLLIQNTSATAPNGFYLKFTAAAPNNTTQHFAYLEDNAAARAIIYSSGTFGSATNTYGAIVSERRFKQDIQDVGSQWDDIKNIRLRKFRFISDVEQNPDAPLQLGVIIDELEQVSPGLITETPVYEEREVTTEVIKTRPVLDEDGEPMLDEDGAPLTEEYTETETTRERGEQIDTHKGWKTSVALLKAMGALQEAMARIESLEARLDSLENL